VYLQYPEITNSVPAHLKECIKKGVVKKKQVQKTAGRRMPALQTTWKERTLVLEEDVLRWRHDRWMYLDHVEKIEEVNPPFRPERSFIVSTHKETLFIQAPSHRDKDEWVVALAKQVHLRSEQHLSSLRRVRGTTAEEEQRAYKRLVKTNAIVHRLTTRNIE
jgi:hypothetical protein